MMAMTMQIPLQNDHPLVSVAEVEAFTMELCTICSNYYEKPQRSYAQPFVNHLICKLLDVTWDAKAFFHSYIAICPECTTRVKTYERKRVELDILRQELVSNVLDTLLHIRPDDNTPLHSLKRPILLRWARESLPPEMKTNENETAPNLRAEGNSVPTNRRKPLQKSEPAVLAPEQGQELDQLSPSRIVGLANQSASGPDSSHEFQELTNSNSCVEPPEIDHQINDAPTNVTVWENVVTTDQTYCSSLQLLAVATENYISENIQEHSTVNYGDIYVEDNAGADNDSEDSENEPDAVNTDGEVVVPEKRQRGEGNRKRKRIRGLTPKPPQHQKPPYMCEICGEVFSHLKPLIRHAKPKTCREEDAYTAKECSICGDDFSSSTWVELKFHIDGKHPNLKIDKCRICKKEFLPNTMAWHKCDELEREPRIPKELPCDYCDKMYYTSGSLSKHMYRKHIKSQDEKAFKCDICNRTFISNSLLTLHKDTHKPSERVFNCPTCDIGLASSKALYTHMKLHTTEKLCICETCGKSFRTPTALKVHNLSHAGVKTFRCEICEKMFTTHSTMHRHVKKHFNPLPGKKEQCPICKCGTAYQRTNTLQKHMVSFHKGTPEQIEICSRTADPHENLIFSQSKTPKISKPSRRSNRKLNKGRH